MSLPMQQICLLASQQSKGGGTTFGSAMTPIAGQFFNVVLEDLKLNRNLKMNRVTTTLTVGPGTNGPFPLPGDYLRVYDLFYPLPTSGGGTGSQGLPQFLSELTMEQFDAEFKDPSMSNYPYFYATDISTQAQVWSGGTQGIGNLTSAGNIFIFPQSSGTLAITFRYMRNQPDYNVVGMTPEINPNQAWFPNAGYLIAATAEKMCGVTGDDRAPQYAADAKRWLAPFLIMEGDEQKATHVIRLDPRTFHYLRSLKLTKSSPLP